MHLLYVIFFWLDVGIIATNELPNIVQNEIHLKKKKTIKKWQLGSCWSMFSFLCCGFVHLSFFFCCHFILCPSLTSNFSSLLMLNVDLPGIQPDTCSHLDMYWYRIECLYHNIAASCQVQLHVHCWFLRIWLVFFPLKPILSERRDPSSLISFSDI